MEEVEIGAGDPSLRIIRFMSRGSLSPLERTIFGVATRKRVGWRGRAVRLVARRKVVVKVGAMKAIVFVGVVWEGICIGCRKLERAIGFGKHFFSARSAKEWHRRCRSEDSTEPCAAGQGKLHDCEVEIGQ